MWKIPGTGRVGLPLALTMFFGLFAVSAALAPRAAHACSGTSVPPMCGVSGTMNKAVPGVVTVPPGTAQVIIPVRVTLFCTPPACALLGPITATVSLVPVGGGPAVATGTATVPSAGCSILGTPVTFNVVINIPPAVRGRFRVVGVTNVPTTAPNLPPGSVTTFAGDTFVCVADEVPGLPGVPRLDMQLISPNPANPFIVVGPGSQVGATYRLTNNDPAESVTVTLEATSKQNARLPTGNAAVYSIAAPFTGDDFPIAFDAPACSIPLSPNPGSYVQPPITQTLTLAPGEVRDVKVSSRSYPKCPSGSCSEQSLTAEGAFSGGDPVVACASTAHIVEVGLPNNCCGQPDVNCPTCNMAGPFTNGMGQSYIEVTLQDTESGLGFIVPTQQSNISVSVPGFMYGTTSAVMVTGTKQDQSQKASVQLTVVDACGNKILCDPVVTDVLRPNGAPAEQTHASLPVAEHFIRVINGIPGLQKLDVIVNGERYQLKGLRDGEERALDVAASMLPGNANVITFRATGKPGGSATVMISDTQ